MRSTIQALLTVMVIAACSPGPVGTPPPTVLPSTSSPSATSVVQSPTPAISLPPAPSPSPSPTPAPSPAPSPSPTVVPTAQATTVPVTLVPSSLPTIDPGQSFEAMTTIEVRLSTAESTITSTTNTSEVACRRDGTGGTALRMMYEYTGDPENVDRFEVFVPDMQAAREGFMASVEYSTEPGASPYVLTSDQIRKNSIDVVDRGSSATISFSGSVRDGSLRVTIDCHQIGP